MTQVYFPDEPANGRDGIYRPETVLNVQGIPDGKRGTIAFVLPR